MNEDDELRRKAFLQPQKSNILLLLVVTIETVSRKIAVTLSRYAGYGKTIDRKRSRFAMTKIGIIIQYNLP